MDNIDPDLKKQYVVLSVKLSNVEKEPRTDEVNSIIKKLNNEIKYVTGKIHNIKSIAEYCFLNLMLFYDFESSIMQELESVGESKFYNFSQLSWLPDIPPSFLNQIVVKGETGQRLEQLEKLKKFFSTRQGKSGVSAGGLLIKALKRDYNNQFSKKEALKQRVDRWNKLVSNFIFTFLSILISFRVELH
jgi:hypothetical protein